MILKPPCSMQHSLDCCLFSSPWIAFAFEKQSEQLVSGGTSDWISWDEQACSSAEHLAWDWIPWDWRIGDWNIGDWICGFASGWQHQQLPQPGDDLRDVGHGEENYHIGDFNDCFGDINGIKHSEVFSAPGAANSAILKVPKRGHWPTIFFLKLTHYISFYWPTIFSF